MACRESIQAQTLEQGVTGSEVQEPSRILLDIKIAYLQVSTRPRVSKEVQAEQGREPRAQRSFVRAAQRNEAPEREAWADKQE